MKTILKILISTLFIINCSVQKNKSEIVYFLPYSVTHEIVKKLKTMNNVDDVSFVLGSDKLGNYTIYLNKKSKEGDRFWVQNSNRVVYIDGNYYPLIFTTDEFFSFPESKISIENKISNGNGLTKQITRRYNVFNVKFKLNGDILR